MVAETGMNDGAGPPTPAPADAGPSGTASGRRRLSRGLIRRLVFLGLAAVGLYVIWPSLWDVFASWPQLGRIEPEWFVGMAAAIAASAVCVWWQYRIVLHVRGWYLIATAQLSSAAFGKIVPGGAASPAAPCSSRCSPRAACAVAAWPAASPPSA